MSKECIVYSLLHVEQLFLLYAADNWHVCYFLWNYSSVTWRWRIRDNQSKSEFLPLNSFVLFRGLFYDTSSSLRLDWSSSLVGQRYKLQQKLNNSSHIGIQKEFWLNDVWGSRSQTTYVYSVWKEWGLFEIQAFIVEMYLLAYASFILVLHSVHKIVCTSQCIA